jgi:hypothetical protein
MQLGGQSRSTQQARTKAHTVSFLSKEKSTVKKHKRHVLMGAYQRIDATCNPELLHSSLAVQVWKEPSTWLKLDKRLSIILIYHIVWTIGHVPCLTAYMTPGVSTYHFDGAAHTVTPRATLWHMPVRTAARWPPCRVRTTQGWCSGARHWRPFKPYRLTWEPTHAVWRKELESDLGRC